MTDVEKVAENCDAAMRLYTAYKLEGSNGARWAQDAGDTIRALLARAEAAEAGRDRVRRMFRRNVRLRLDAEASRDRANMNCEVLARDVDALSARLAEVEAANARLREIAEWRKSCHEYDKDMGHAPREFDVEDVRMLEYAARAALTDAQEQGT